MVFSYIFEVQNIVTRYSMAKEDLIGNANEPNQEFDLIEVVIIRREKKHQEMIYSSIWNQYFNQILKE